jgi:hypothetical protein
VIARLAPLLVLAAGCTQCTGGGSDADAGPDARAETGPAYDAAAEAGDGGVISDWPNWRRLTEIDPTCPQDIPTDPLLALPTVAWIPCSDGRPKCLQVDTTTWNDGSSPINFSLGFMSEGLTHLILLGRPVVDVTGPDATAESDVIDVATWKIVTGLRVRLAADWSTYGVCVGDIAASKSELEILDEPLTHPGPIQIDRRPLAQAGNVAPSFVPTDLNPWSQLGQSTVVRTSASDTTLALEFQPVSLLGRVDGTSTHVTVTSKIALTFPLVVGSDVYAVDQTGTDGWARIMRVDADGSLTEYRAVPGHRVATPASDGTTMYWTECYGGSDPTSNVQPNVEMWAAPYTNDPTTLAATAQKVATLGTHCVYDQQQLAQNGMFFAISGLTNYVWRKSDGKLLSFTNGGNRATWYPLYISQGEYWSIEAVQGGPKGVALTRIQLGPW